MKQYTEGDGSWQMRLDAGRCPKCSSNLTLSKVDGTIFCDVCGLEVVDSSIVFDTISNRDKESEMETHLMPDEASIADKEPRMQWREAVSVIDSIVMTEAENIQDHDGDPVFAQTVRDAWQRILQG